MSDIDFAEMRKIAENATSGPWESMGRFIETKEWVEGQDGDIVSPEVDCMAYCYGGSARGIGNPSDAEFIATFNPQTVLALLDRVETAEATVTRQERYIEGLERVDQVGLTRRAEAAEQALQRVRELHECFEAPNGYRWCSGCSTDEYPEDWPCGTIEALKGAPEPVDHSELIAEAREACEQLYFKGTYQQALMSRLADALEGKNQ